MRDAVREAAGFSKGQPQFKDIVYMGQYASMTYKYTNVQMI